MNEEDIKTIDELIEFMDKEAELWGHADSENATANGRGIKTQWDAHLEAERDFPCMIFYMEGKEPTLEEISATPFPRADGTKQISF